MFNAIPKDPSIFTNWNWAQYKPYYEELRKIELNPTNIDRFLRARIGAPCSDGCYNQNGNERNLAH